MKPIAGCQFRSRSHIIRPTRILKCGDGVPSGSTSPTSVLQLRILGGEILSSQFCLSLSSLINRPQIKCLFSLSFNPTLTPGGWIGLTPHRVTAPSSLLLVFMKASPHRPHRGSENILYDDNRVAFHGVLSELWGKELTSGRALGTYPRPVVLVCCLFVHDAKSVRSAPGGQQTG